MRSETLVSRHGPEVRQMYTSRFVPMQGWLTDLNGQTHCDLNNLTIITITDQHCH